MPTFTYRVRNPQGELITGTLEAPDEGAVAADLGRLGYSVLSIRSEATAGSLKGLIEKVRPIEKQQVILFTRQLSALIRSGMSLLPALETISGQTVKAKFKVILQDIRQSVQGGSSFSEALAKYPRVFSELFVSMVEVGEAGGVLDKVLDRLSVLGTQEMEVQSRIRSALVYPIVLVIVAFCVVNFILIGVIPKFVMVFRASEAALPLPTKIVMGLSWSVRKLWLPGLAVLGLLFFWFRRILETESGRMRFHQMLLRLPIFGPLYTKIQISRFCRTLAVLTATGVPLLQGLAVVEKTITNVAIRRAVQTIRAALTAGSSLVEPVKATGFFSPMAVQMISIGEKSGALDRCLEEIAQFYDPEIEYTIKNLTALLEPFMLLGMGLTVAFVAMSVLLPIFNLMRVFRQ